MVKYSKLQLVSEHRLSFDVKFVINSILELIGLSCPLALPGEDWLPCQAFVGLTALLLSVLNELTLVFPDTPKARSASPFSVFVGSAHFP